MNRTKTAIAIATTVILFTTIFFATVFAQEPLPPPEAPTEGQTFLYVVGAWLLYTLMGLLASLANNQVFDASKFGKTIIWMIVVAVLAIGLKIHPTIVVTEYSNLVVSTVDFLAQTGLGLTLIYFIDKLYMIITGFAARIRSTALPG